MSFPSLHRLLVTSVLLASTLSMNAATTFWTNDAGGSFTAPANWLGGVPGAGDTAVIWTNGNYQLTLPADHQVSSLHYDMNGTVGQLFSGSSLTVTGLFLVGNSSPFTSDVLHLGGTVLVTNSSGSAEMVVGYQGVGLYSVSSGEVQADRLVVGYASGSSGNVLQVYGSSSVMTAGILHVGDQGAGNLTVISNGGLLVSTNAVVGQLAAGSNNSVLLTGTGSRWTNTQSLIIGGEGHSSTVTVSNAAVLAAEQIRMGTNASSTLNALLVEEAMLILTSSAAASRLVLGEAGSGSFTMNGGTSVVTRLVATNASQINLNHGLLQTLTGATVNAGSTLSVGNTSGRTATWELGGTSNSFHLSSLELASVANATGQMTVLSGGRMGVFHITNSLLVATNAADSRGVLELGDMQGGQFTVGLQDGGSRLEMANASVTLTNASTLINTSGDGRSIYLAASGSNILSSWRQQGGSFTASNISYFSVANAYGLSPNTGLVTLVGSTNLIHGSGFGDLTLGGGSGGLASLSLEHSTSTVQGFSGLGIGLYGATGAYAVVGGSNRLEMGGVLVGFSGGQGLLLLTNGARAHFGTGNLTMGDDNGGPGGSTGIIQAVAGSGFQSFSVTNTVLLATNTSSYSAIQLGDMQGGQAEFLLEGTLPWETPDFELGNGAFTVTNGHVTFGRNLTVADRHFSMASAADGNQASVTVHQGSFLFTNTFSVNIANGFSTLSNMTGAVTLSETSYRLGHTNSYLRMGWGTGTVASLTLRGSTGVIGGALEAGWSDGSASIVVDGGSNAFTLSYAMMGRDGGEFSMVVTNGATASLSASSLEMAQINSVSRPQEAVLRVSSDSTMAGFTVENGILLATNAQSHAVLDLGNMRSNTLTVGMAWSGSGLHVGNASLIATNARVLLNTSGAGRTISVASGTADATGLVRFVDSDVTLSNIQSLRVAAGTSSQGVFEILGGRMEGEVQNIQIGNWGYQGEARVSFRAEGTVTNSGFIEFGTGSSNATLEVGTGRLVLTHSTWMTGGGSNTVTVRDGGELRLDGFDNLFQVASGTHLTLSNQGTVTLTNATALFDFQGGSSLRGGGTANGSVRLQSNAALEVDAHLTVNGFLTNAAGSLVALISTNDILTVRDGLRAESDIVIEAGPGFGGITPDFSINDFSGIELLSTDFTIQTNSIITWQLTGVSFSWTRTNPFLGGMRVAGSTDIFMPHILSGNIVATGLEPGFSLSTYEHAGFYYLAIIPEPSHFGLLALGLLAVGAALLRRHRRSDKSA